MPDGPDLTPPYRRTASGLGLVPIDAAHWIVPDDQADTLAEKRTLLARGDRHFSLPQAAPALGILAQKLAGLGIAPSSAAIEHIAACFSDDPVLLLPDSDTFNVVAASLCSPTFFDLDVIRGHGLGPIHAPVPDADQSRAKRIARVFAMLQPDMVLERFNWTVQWGDARFTPDGAPLRAAANAANVDDAPTHLFERVERQTIVKLAPTNAVLFNIRVRLTPIWQRLQHPLDGPALAHAWRHLAPEMAAYKKLACYERHMAHVLKLAAL